MTSELFNTGWVVRPKVSIFAQLAGPADAAVPVTLPHDAMITQDRAPEHPGGRAYFPGGCFEYSKSFDVPDEWRSKRVSLEFQGVYRDAVVFVNKAAAGHRPYGYSPFMVRLDPYLRYGEPNTVRVEARAHDDSRWYTGAGIYRDVRLIVTELVHIAPQGIRVTTPDVDHERAVVEVSADVRNDGLSTETAAVEITIANGDGTVVAAGGTPVTTRAGHSAVARARVYVDNPQLWDVDHPQLYTATVTLRSADAVIQREKVRFGVRTLRLDPRHGLRINGRSVKLRGACLHHDNGILGAAAIGRAEERKVELLKAAGFNAIRSSHNPLSPVILDACDRVGMLVMDEAFDVWTESKSSHDYSLAFPDWWERDIEAMVLKDVNHPSVIMYSIGNEIPETGNPFGSEWGRRLAEKVRALDSTRFVTNGINGLVSTIDEVAAIGQEQRDRAAVEPKGGVNELMASLQELENDLNASTMVTERTAESFASLDVAGMNYGDARYQMDRELFPNRIIVGSETFTPRIAKNWRLISESPHVIGDFTWTGHDYLGEVGIGRVQYADETPAFEAPFPWIAAWCGDLDITGYRRPASYYREIVFGLRAEPYIAVHRPENFTRTALPAGWNWTDSVASWTWAVEPGTPIRVEVYTDSDEVELLLDGEPIGRRTVGADVALVASFETEYRPGKLTAVAYRNGLETGRTTLHSAVTPTALTATADRTTLAADEADLSFISIELHDSTGTLVTSDDRPVVVTVDGPAVLQALGSARPDNAERYDTGRHTTFDGRALAVVRPTGVGQITVTLTSEHLEPVVLELTAAAEPAGRRAHGDASPRGGGPVPNR